MRDGQLPLSNATLTNDPVASLLQVEDVPPVPIALGTRSQHHDRAKHWLASIKIDESEPAATLEEAAAIALLSEGRILSVREIVDEGTFVVTPSPKISACIKESGYWQWIGPERQSITVESECCI